MCGIVDLLTYHECSDEYLYSVATAITSQEAEDSGFWLILSEIIGLDRHRPSSVELSDAGHQPMQAACERPKVVFCVPIVCWLRYPSQYCTEGLLNESRLEQEYFFNPEPIPQKWVDYLSGQYHLCSQLMFKNCLAEGK